MFFGVCGLHVLCGVCGLSYLNTCYLGSESQVCAPLDGEAPLLLEIVPLQLHCHQLFRHLDLFSCQHSNLNIFLVKEKLAPLSYLATYDLPGVLSDTN